MVSSFNKRQYWIGTKKNNLNWWKIQNYLDLKKWMGGTGSLFMIWPVSGDWRLCRCIWLSNIKNLMMKTTLCKWWSISVSTTTWTINADILNIYIHIHIWAISVHSDEIAKKQQLHEQRMKEWRGNTIHRSNTRTECVANQMCIEWKTKLCTMDFTNLLRILYMFSSWIEWCNLFTIRLFCYTPPNR